jgi:hypothetical protein
MKIFSNFLSTLDSDWIRILISAYGSETLPPPHTQNVSELEFPDTRHVVLA